MIYDFDEVVDRHDSNSVKWDLIPDPELIPMWVADMDFKTAPFILDAVMKRVGHGVFGYAHVPERYYRTVIEWFQKRRGWTIEREWIRYISSLVPGLAMAVQALTEVGDKVLFHSPAYNCFFSSPSRNGREVLPCPLKNDGYGHFSMDFEDIERKCSDPKAKLFILCNPHNPCGRVWSREELMRFGEICCRHGITVVSDEIHCELEMPGHRYVPFASLCEAFRDISVTFCSPSKPFNIAGLEIANIITPDPVKREKILRTIEACEHCDLNPLGIDALQAAYSPEGEEWLRQLNEYLYSNFTTAETLISAGLPGFRLTPLEGTYLSWLDCSPLTARGISTEFAQKSMIEVEKLWVNSGTMYGDGNFMRINLACPRSTMVEGISRMIKGLKRLMNY